MNRTDSAIVVALLSLSAGTAAHAGLMFEFSDGPGLLTLEGADPAKADAIRAGAEAAAMRWEALWADDVTLKIALDYDASLPALGASFATFDPSGTPYAAVKDAMIDDASSPPDATAIGHLQPGPFLDYLVNDDMTPPEFPAHFDADGSPNNASMDITSSNLKALGLLPGHDGLDGSDGTITIGASDFDFDPADGIDGDKYDFVGVVLHELAHNMGFISGVDTVASLFAGFPIVPPGDPDTAIMATTLDLFRYSSDSIGVGPDIPDLSLPTPGASFTRFFSIDGGATVIDEFSTGTALGGDGEQAGHWKEDAMFGLMDPDLAKGFALTDTFDGMAGGPTADYIALDVIGWTPVPTPGTVALVAIAGLGALRRRR